MSSNDDGSDREPAIVPPIFQWAESLSTNLETLEKEIEIDRAKLQAFHSKYGSNHNSDKCLPFASPKSIKSAKSVKSLRSVIHLSPIAAKKSQASSSVFHSPPASALDRDMAQHTIISFQTNESAVEPRNDNADAVVANKQFSDLSQTLHSTATRVTSDGDRIIADVAKKIWGKNVPQTFLTALDLELPLSESEDANGDKSNRYSSGAYSSYRTKSPVVGRRRSLILPALEVTKENIPPDLHKQNLGFPNKTDPDSVIPQIIEGTQFDSNRDKDVFTNCVASNYSLDIISDGFWWFLIDEWKQQEMETYKETQHAVFSRMSKNYVNLFLASPQNDKDMIFNNYYDVLSQSIFTCFVQQYPKSKHLFTKEIKMKIVCMTAKWTMGYVPSTLSVDHWYIAMNTHKKQQRDKSEATGVTQQVTNYVIPTQTMRKAMVFGHSEFVQYYLKYEAKCEVGEKSTVKLTMTYNKPTCEDELLFHTLSEESAKCQQESEEARTCLMNAQKELNKLIRTDANAAKEYLSELQKEELLQMKNKKQFVKDILKQTIPNEFDLERDAK